MDIGDIGDAMISPAPSKISAHATAQISARVTVSVDISDIHASSVANARTAAWYSSSETDR